MKVSDPKLNGFGLTVTFVPENVKEAELLGGAAALLAFDPDPATAAVDVEALALALGFPLPKVG